MNFDQIYLLFLKAYELDISCHAFTEKIVYFNYNDIQLNFYKKNGFDCRLVDMGRDDLGLDELPYKLCLYCQDKVRLEQFKFEMQKIVQNTLTAEYTDPHTLEYLPILTYTQASDDDEDDLIQTYLLV